MIDIAIRARYFSISTDSTFDISHKEQLSFVVKYLFNSNICERLIALSESSNTTGQSLFELFKSVMEKIGLDWNQHLIGQSYDGAANMRGPYSGLQAHIIKENPKALYVWCHAHRFNLIVLSAVGCCKEAVDLFGYMEKLYSFIVGSKKRSDIYRKNQSELYPKKQLKAIKRVGTTRWMSNSFALSTVLETLEAILDMLEQIKNVEGPVDFKTGSELIDIILQQLSDRFDKNTISVMKDLGLLSLKRLKEVGPVPQDAFSKICDVYGINQESVRNDYILLKSVIKDIDLNLLTKLPAKLHDDCEEYIRGSDESNIEDEEERQDLNNVGSLRNIFEIINNMNIKSEFEHLYTIIKISLTLPTSSCTVERSFSKLKIIKSRLRSTMGQNRLENLMIISCEQDINIDVSKVNMIQNLYLFLLNSSISVPFLAQCHI
ncbi:zinc finger MYM-type protein 1-like [Metopolophium dirhodum]|uniref:zinc finger MYM-type protein 1-like n=1 Tax=Metopolophium dirhodum TaxID=44670 RepID=UPI00298F8940|nr:zinc finger MYM-type protein 1-like [Metopolophium dirhodum]